jgi:hypothetical protein
MASPTISWWKKLRHIKRTLDPLHNNDCVSCGSFPLYDGKNKGRQLHAVVLFSVHDKSETTRQQGINEQELKAT